MYVGLSSSATTVHYDTIYLCLRSSTLFISIYSHHHPMACWHSQRPVAALPAGLLPAYSSGSDSDSPSGSDSDCPSSRPSVPGCALATALCCGGGRCLFPHPPASGLAWVLTILGGCCVLLLRSQAAVQLRAHTPTLSRRWTHPIYLHRAALRPRFLSWCHQTSKL